MKSNEEVRLTIKKIMVSRGFLSLKANSGEVWSKEDSEAWNMFSNSVAGLRYFSTKIPSLETLSEDALKKIELMGKDLEIPMNSEENSMKLEESIIEELNQDTSMIADVQEPEIKENGVDGIIPEQKESEEASEEAIDKDEAEEVKEEIPAEEVTTKRDRKKKEA